MVNPGRLLAVAPLLLAVAMHPMHTSSAELSYDLTARRAELVVRVFADEFQTLGGDDAARAARVAGGIVITARDGRVLRFGLGGIGRRADIVELRLSAPLDAGLAGARMLDTVLFDRYADQVNIVRVRSGDRTGTLLFTRGSGARALP